MCWPWRLAIAYILLKRGTMADFVVKTSTDSISISWDNATVSGLSEFTITLNDALRYTGDDAAKPPFKINGLLPGTTYRVIINSTTSGMTTTVLDEIKSTAMARHDGVVEHKGTLYTLYKERKNYNDAKAACEAKNNGDLVTVDSVDVQEVLSSLRAINVWIGARRTKTGWRWVGSGKSLKFQGCYGDNNNMRLSVFVSSRSDNTPDSCVVECRKRKHKYAGVTRDEKVQSHVVCRCGDAYHQDQYIPTCNNAMRINGVDSAGVTGWSNKEPDNRLSYEPCLVLVQYTTLSWGDVQCFHADLSGYGFLCEYDLTQSNCQDKYAAGKCYSIHAPSTGSWFDARWTCAENGGELLQVDTEAFFNILRSELTFYSWWWIGGSRVHWNWPNGKEMLYTNWARNKPISEASSCIVIARDEKWEDMSCNRAYGFICESVGTLPTTKTTPKSHTKTVSSTATTPSNNDGTVVRTTSGPMVTGAVIGIAVGTSVLVLACLAIILLIIRRKRHADSPFEEVVLQETHAAQLDDSHWLYALDRELIRSKISERTLTLVANNMHDIFGVSLTMGFNNAQVRQYQEVCPHDVKMQLNRMFVDWRKGVKDASVEQFVRLMCETDIDDNILRDIITQELSAV